MNGTMIENDKKTGEEILRLFITVLASFGRDSTGFGRGRLALDADHFFGRGLFFGRGTVALDAEPSLWTRTGFGAE